MRKRVSRALRTLRARAGEEDARERLPRPLRRAARRGRRRPRGRAAGRLQGALRACSSHWPRVSSQPPTGASGWRRPRRGRCRDSAFAHALPRPPQRRLAPVLVFADFRGRFGAQLSAAAAELAAARRPLAVARRRRLPWLTRPVAVGLALTAFAGSAFAAVAIWTPLLGNPQYGYNPGVATTAPPADQLAALAVLRRPQTDADRGALSAAALTYINDYTTGVRTAYVRLLATVGTEAFVLVPVAERRSSASTGGAPSESAPLANALCLYVSDTSPTAHARRVLVARAGARRGRAWATLRRTVLRPRAGRRVTGVTVTAVGGPHRVSRPITNNLFVLTLSPSDAPPIGSALGHASPAADSRVRAPVRERGRVTDGNLRAALSGRASPRPREHPYAGPFVRYPIGVGRLNPARLGWLASELLVLTTDGNLTHYTRHLRSVRAFLIGGGARWRADRVLLASQHASAYGVNYCVGWEPSTGSCVGPEHTPHGEHRLRRHRQQCLGLRDRPVRRAAAITVAGPAATASPRPATPATQLLKGEIYNASSYWLYMNGTEFYSQGCP